VCVDGFYDGMIYMSRYYPESKVEVQGFTARHYDILMNILFLGKYSGLINDAVVAMGIKPSDKILDLGAGTGRNACLMAKGIASDGEILGLDISDEMISQFRQKCSGMPNVKIANARIDEPLDYESYFDKAFMSFVLHGLPHEVRIKVLKNVLESLKNGGKFFIFDFNEFRLDEMPFYLRIPFKIIECPYAFDFIERDWSAILASAGFGEITEYAFLGGYIRLIEAVKN